MTNMKVSKDLKKAIYDYFAIKEMQGGSFKSTEQKDYYLSKIYKVAIVNNIGVTIVPGCIELYNAESDILIFRNDIFTFDPKYDDEQLYEKSLDEIKSEKELDSI